MSSHRMIGLLILILVCPNPLLAQEEGERGTPAFRDPLSRDPMIAKMFSLAAPGLGHLYNGRPRKMKKYRRLYGLALLPYGVGLILDIQRDALDGVDQFRDLSVRRFPWWTVVGIVVSGGLTEWVQGMDAQEAYRDALDKSR